MSKPMWMLSPLSQSDVAEAQERFEQAEPLTAREWAALVWYWTDIPTVAMSRDKDGKITAFDCLDAAQDADGQPLPKRLAYYPPSHIADKKHAWYAASEGQMRDWIALLQDGHDKRAAWNYLHGYYIVREGEDAGEPPRSLRRMRQQLAEHKAFRFAPVASAEKGALSVEQRREIEAELRTGRRERGYYDPDCDLEKQEEAARGGKG